MLEAGGNIIYCAWFVWLYEGVAHLSLHVHLDWWTLWFHHVVSYCFLCTQRVHPRDSIWQPNHSPPEKPVQSQEIIKKSGTENEENCKLTKESHDLHPSQYRDSCATYLIGVITQKDIRCFDVSMNVFLLMNILQGINLWKKVCIVEISCVSPVQSENME